MPKYEGGPIIRIGQLEWPSMKFCEVRQKYDEALAYRSVQIWLKQLLFEENKVDEALVFSKQYPLWLWDEVVKQMRRALTRGIEINSPVGWVRVVSGRILKRKTNQKHS